MEAKPTFFLAIVEKLTRNYAFKLSLFSYFLDLGRFHSFRPFQKIQNCGWDLFFFLKTNQLKKFHCVFVNFKYVNEIYDFSSSLLLSQRDFILCIHLAVHMAM